jgi:flagellar biogenesis protein FliO
MSTRLDVEEIQTTKSEKLLALVLAAFLLVGGIWVYVKIDDAVRSSSPRDYSYRGTPADQVAVTRLRAADQRSARAQHEVIATRDNLELRREAYRTALEAHRPEAARLGSAYDRARARYAKARQEAASASLAVARARPPADAAQRHIAKVQTGQVHKRELLAFALRLAWVLANLLFGYWFLARLRRRGSRYFPVGIAFLGYAVVLAFVMATDYVTDYFDPLDLGPLVLSLVGIGLTLLAFVGLQRYLAKRVPHRRVRKGECPFCGYPVRQGAHCEGCGREVVAPCARCSKPRRVGTARCAACGAA